MTARPKQILLWAATGLIWLVTPVAGPTFLVFPFFIRLIATAWSTPSGIDFMAWSGFALLWFGALVAVGMIHHGKARWAHFAGAILITGGTLALGWLMPQPDTTTQLYQIP